MATLNSHTTFYFPLYTAYFKRTLFKNAHRFILSEFQLVSSPNSCDFGQSVATSDNPGGKLRSRVEAWTSKQLKALMLFKRLSRWAQAASETARGNLLSHESSGRSQCLDVRCLFRGETSKGSLLLCLHDSGE